MGRDRELHKLGHDSNKVDQSQRLGLGKLMAIVRWADYILKEEPMGFADGFDIKYEKKRGVSYGFEVLA